MSASRTVLLVGATQGLGLALAERYLGEGWNVVATTLAPSPGLTDLAARFHDRLEIHPLDITDAAAVAALRDTLSTRSLAALHIVAGILPVETGPVWEQPSDIVLKVLETNAFGGVRLATAFADLVAPEGVFAFTSSGMGSMTRNDRGGAPLYRISKAALNMLVRSFAAEHASGRAVLLICPGWVKTQMGGDLATVEIADSVDGIYRLVCQARATDGAPFLEYTGDTVPW